VISAVILTGAAIALGLAVLAWSQSRSSAYIKDYGEATDAEMARLKERLAVEHIFYNKSSNSIRVYLLNSGATDDVKIQSVHIADGEDLHQTFSSLSLYFFNGTLVPDEDGDGEDDGLDMGEEGYVVLPNPPDPALPTLTAGTYYYVRVVTERGSLFDSGFVA